ncbi:MAG: valine--tRNA ligase [Candidatus Taylorbacteria bacterium]|nr:valine--tRNA ligase [Candidatus Taylorbacteria bacterium]
MPLNEKFLKPYDPQEAESRIYKLWEDSGFFNPDNLPTTPSTLNPKPFSMIMPPANANGSLHAGHALVMTVEDIITRFRRMQGFKTLWLPGLDHAGFETQVVYEKQLEKEGRSRFGMEPKKLYEEILAFTLENSKNIESQIRKMGASCDWSRKQFTLDQNIVKEVQKTFKKMSDDGLVYRGERIVNWCPKHATSLSDVETESKEKKDPFYYFKYGPFTIGTTRPETKFGDKHVVMHPDDKRYSEYKHGQTFDLEWINGPITATVIKDKSIDMEMGSGVMTITPWHTAIDFDIAERHNLPKEQVIDMRGKLLPIAGEFAGMKISEARPKIVEKLKSKGLLVKIDENYVHNVPVCYKCETTIEPQILPQWFVKMKPLAEKAIEAVESGKIKFIPDNYRKIFLYWMNNTIDWNISRQIVWGIPIPAKICNNCGEGVADLDDSVKECPKCHGSVRADTDTFDTWFSSGQWPLLTLGYPNGLDFKKFYPTDVMETGSDLIFKWIPRMVIFGLYLTKDVPFKTVYLHGMVNDAKGQKMSKSKGNVINPLILAEKFGTDALRIGLIAGNTPGTPLSLSEDKIRGYKNFANKLWNIARFILENTDGVLYDRGFDKYTEDDIQLRKERHDLTVDITKDIEEYRFYMSAEKIYHYIWHNLADKIIEESKIIFKDGSESSKLSRKQLLLHSLREILIMLHPFMPFVTEEIWQTWHTPGNNNEETITKKALLMVEQWPY